MHTISVRTTSHDDLRDITNEVATVVGNAGVTSGICVVMVPHTTAGITINENADPSVRDDITNTLDRMVPLDGPYAHAEGNSAAHVKAAMMGHTAILPIEGGALVLGTWQGIYFCEFDGPRSRKVNVQIVASLTP
jgi:secondary thiamine-phosphate synthase enzyme